MFFGTKTICESINKNIAIKHWLVFSNNYEILNPRLASVNVLIQNLRFVKETKLLDPELKHIEYLNHINQQNIRMLLNAQATDILIGTKALINGYGKISFSINIWLIMT